MSSSNTAITAANSSNCSNLLTIAESILQSDFATTRATTSLRVTCYGSSSSLTPIPYLQEALHAGYLLAKRGHVCVNGAGSYGCMAALNDGASLGHGHIVGVIHEMWLVDDGGNSSNSNKKRDSNNKGDIQQKKWGLTRSLRDGGAHGVFSSTVPQSHGGPHPALNQSNDNNTNREGPIREMLVAGGKDLQERKRLLVDRSDALLVLPGGPGTWDELWEMACARNIGLTTMPIVCVNTNGYYDPFRIMLERAHQDKLTKLAPHEILQFADTSEEAIQWIESNRDTTPKVILKQRQASASAALRSDSILSTPILGDSSSSWFSETFRRAASWISDAPLPNSKQNNDGGNSQQNIQTAIPVPLLVQTLGAFGTGVAVGMIISSRNR